MNAGEPSAVLGAYASRVFKRKRINMPYPNPVPGQNPFDGLRQQALDSSPDLAGWAARPEGRRVYGGILDWGLDRGVATLFALDDGTASLYLSSGGGVIGSFHETVRQAVREFLLAFEPFVEDMERDVTGDRPPSDTTDLRALTIAGRVFVRASTEEFGKGTHPMAAVFHSGQALITELRQVANMGG